MYLEVDVMEKKIAILGGGVSGVCVAAELSKDNRFSVELIERESYLGGLHRSVQKNGYAFDIGLFLFQEDHELLRTFPFLINDLVEVQPIHLTVTPKGTIDRYPLTLKVYKEDNGWFGLLRAACSLAYSKCLYYKRDSVPAFAKYYMGAAVYRQGGVQNYIERLYGMKDEEVGLEFAMQRLAHFAGLQVSRAFVHALPVGLASRFKRLSTEWPTRVFARPPAGFEVLYRKIAEHLRANGVSIRLSCEARSVQKDGGQFLVDFGSFKKSYDKVVSTIPIPVMLRLIGEKMDARIDNMGLYSLFYQGVPRHKWTTMFNLSLSGAWKRMINFSNFYKEKGTENHIAVEVTTKGTTEQSLQLMRTDFERHVARIGLFQEPPEYLGGVITERAYPVFRTDDNSRIEQERNKLSAFGIESVGRQGNFEYLSSSAAAANARSLATAIRLNTV
jgi:protoporphyrinogen oxidase